MQYALFAEYAVIVVLVKQHRPTTLVINGHIDFI